MKNGYVVKFFHKGDAKEMLFTATNLLDLYEQIEEFKSSGKFAPLYSDEIESITGLAGNKND